MINLAHKSINTQPQPLCLSDIAWIEMFFRNLIEPIADVNPAVILTWRNTEHLEYIVEDGVLYVFGDSDIGRILWLPPLGASELSLANILRGFELLIETQGVTTLCTIDNLWEQYPLWSELKHNTAYLINSDSAEYQYETSAIARLAGHRLKTKRADARFFLNTYRPNIAPYEPCVAPDCIALLDRWLIQKKERCAGVVLDKVIREYEVCKETLCDRLPLEGVVCTVDSRLVAFSLGVGQEHHVFNCLFEKADLALRGCSTFIFSTLAKILEGRFSYINAGEDWGLHELALSKQLWRPIVTRKIYRLSQKIND